jgi:hypothetical protein
MPIYAITIEVITTVLLGVRLISRFNKLGGRLGLDDIFIVLGWIVAVAMTSAVTYSMPMSSRLFPINANALSVHTPRV